MLQASSVVINESRISSSVTGVSAPFLFLFSPLFLCRFIFTPFYLFLFVKLPLSYSTILLLHILFFVLRLFFFPYIFLVQIFVFGFISSCSLHIFFFIFSSSYLIIINIRFSSSPFFFFLYPHLFLFFLFTSCAQPVLCYAVIIHNCLLSGYPNVILSSSVVWIS